MTVRHARAGARISLALLTATAIAVQAVSSARAHASLWNFFSFFTIESNLIVVAALLIPQARMLRGAATLYIAITGIVYALLLSGLEASLQTTIPWVNVVLHDVTPAAMLVDWLVEPALLALPIAPLLLRWLAYPLAYLAYSLARGALIGWYPYPFLDPVRSGYARVALVSCAIALVSALLGAAIARYARWRHR